MFGWIVELMRRVFTSFIVTLMTRSFFSIPWAINSYSEMKESNRHAYKANVLSQAPKS